jgi:hypothetical protein
MAESKKDTKVFGTKTEAQENVKKFCSLYSVLGLGEWQRVVVWKWKQLIFILGFYILLRVLHQGYWKNRLSQQLFKVSIYLFRRYMFRP